MILSRGHWNCATFDVRKENSSDLLSGSRRNIIQFFGSFVWPVTFLLTPCPLFSLVASFRLSGTYVSHTTSARLLRWSCCGSFDSRQTVDYYCVIQTLQSISLTDDLTIQNFQVQGPFDGYSYQFPAPKNSEAGRRRLLLNRINIAIALQRQIGASCILMRVFSSSSALLSSLRFWPARSWAFYSFERLGHFNASLVHSWQMIHFFQSSDIEIKAPRRIKIQKN